MENLAILVLFGLIVLFAVAVLAKTIRIVPQARAGIVERFGKYKGTLPAGLNMVVPFVDRVRYMIDLREQVVSFPPQPVITEDNLVVSIDTVIYFQVTNPVSATYEIANYIQAVEQLTMTTLRNIVGGMDLEQTLTSRDEINQRLRGVLDEATGKWGIRVNRVELKGIDPPPSIKDSMEKQMRADRDKRAVILTAEGQRQSSILTAEGSKQAAILSAEGDREALILRAQADRESQILKAQGEGQAIQTVFQAIHDGAPDQALLAYQYLQMLPKIADGSANKVWVVPSEITKALEGLGSTLGGASGIPVSNDGPRRRVDPGQPAAEIAAGSVANTDSTLARAHQEVAAAIAAAEESIAGSSRASTVASADVPLTEATVDRASVPEAGGEPATDAAVPSGATAAVPPAGPPPRP
jgi:regulator of protease activity HflC (stomatin/prohibitin superfamily)